MRDRSSRRPDPTAECTYWHAWADGGAVASTSGVGVALARPTGSQVVSVAQTAGNASPAQPILLHLETPTLRLTSH